MLRLQRGDGLSAVERNTVALVTAGLVASGNQTAYLHNHGHGLWSSLSLRLGVGEGLGFEPFLAQQAPPQRPSQLGQQQCRTFVGAPMLCSTLDRRLPPLAAQNPTVPRLSVSKQTRAVRKMEFLRCIAFVEYGTSTRKVHLILRKTRLAMQARPINRQPVEPLLSP